jgi:hypothetical protein
VRLDALIRGGKHVKAQQSRQQQLCVQQSVRLKRQAAGVYKALGLDSVATSLS